MRRPLLWALPWMCLPGLAALIQSPMVQADSVVDRYAAQNAGRVCQVLDRFPTFDGIGGIADAIVNNSNLTYRDAGEVIAISVITVCPGHQGLLDDLVKAYATDPVQMTAAVGGRIA